MKLKELRISMKPIQVMGGTVVMYQSAGIEATVIADNGKQELTWLGIVEDTLLDSLVKQIETHLEQKHRQELTAQAAL
jgi:hypothetical protein